MIEFTIEINGTEEEIKWIKSNYSQLVKSATPKRGHSITSTYCHNNYFTLVVKSNSNFHYEKIIKEIKVNLPNCRYNGNVKSFKTFFGDFVQTKYNYDVESYED